MINMPKNSNCHRTAKCIQFCKNYQYKQTVNCCCNYMSYLLNYYVRSINQNNLQERKLGTSNKATMLIQTSEIRMFRTVAGTIIIY